MRSIICQVKASVKMPACPACSPCSVPESQVSESVSGEACSPCSECAGEHANTLKTPEHAKSPILPLLPCAHIGNARMYIDAHITPAPPGVQRIGFSSVFRPSSVFRVFSTPSWVQVASATRKLPGWLRRKLRREAVELARLHWPDEAAVEAAVFGALSRWRKTPWRMIPPDLRRLPGESSLAYTDRCYAAHGCRLSSPETSETPQTAFLGQTKGTTP